jgi:hypothetical protein
MEASNGKVLLTYKIFLFLIKSKLDKIVYNAMFLNYKSKLLWNSIIYQDINKAKIYV